MVVVRIPALLAAQAAGRNRFEVEAATVADALRALPISALIFDEGGELRPLVNVYVDGADVQDRGGLAAAVASNAEIRVVAAIAGG